jgi:HEAT repeat protein
MSEHRREGRKMSHRRLYYGFFVPSLLFGLVCVTLPGQSEAKSTYEGRTFQEWEPHLKDPTEADRVQAVLAMTKLPPGPTVLALARVLLEDPSPRVREEAAIALRKIKKTIGRAVPALMQALKDPYPNVRYAAALTLAREGKPVVIPDADLSAEEEYPVARSGREELTALVEGLGDSDARIRQGAAKILARLGPAAKPAVPELLQALEDPAPGVREAAGEALRQIGPEAVPALVQALSAQRADVRESAALALGLIGPAAQNAIPHLRELSANDPSPHVARAAEQALTKIQSR